jgi:hypothetical protein
VAGSGATVLPVHRAWMTIRKGCDR